MGKISIAITNKRGYYSSGNFTSGNYTGSVHILFKFIRRLHMRYGISILGILVVLLLAWLASSNRKEVKFKPIIMMIIIQIILSLLLLNTEYGLIIINGIATIFSILLEYANEGVSFVFGGL